MANKIALISVSESLDTSSPLSEGVMLMLGIIAGWEREGIVERVKAGIVRAKKLGTRSGKPIGRPRARIPQKAIDAVRGGASLRSTARKYDVPIATLQRRIKNTPPPG